jgi:hypothetical protein
MTNASMPVPTRRVDMWFSGTAPQRRVTVVFRLILVIPQIVVLAFLAVAGFFVAVIGWFAALFTGRLPDFAHNYLSGLVRWEVRVNAYILLLTDQYPPFSFDDMDYPVRPILPGPGQLNRLSVLFRLVLAIPAAVFAQIVNYGLTVPLSIAMWVVVIVTGRLPPTLYTTYAALVRYQARLGAWFTMLTSEYAWGMFGDFVPPAPATPPPPIGAAEGGGTQAVPPPPPPVPSAPSAPPAPPAPPQDQPPFSYPSTGSTGEQTATPPAYPGAAPGSSGWSPPQPPPSAGSPGIPGAMPPPSSWERTSLPSSVEPLPPWGILILQGAAKGWMIFAVVWGSIVFIAVDATRAHRHPHHTTSGLVTTVAANTSGPGSSHVVVRSPAGELIPAGARPQESPSP